MPFSKEGLKKSPYNKCIICDRLGESCDGPNLLILDVQKISEWVNIRQEYLRITNEKLAEMAQVSVNTVCRIKAAENNPDGEFKLTYLQRVVRVLIGGKLGTHPCPMEDRTQDTQLVQELKDECKRLNAVIERKEKEHAEAIEKIEREANRKTIIVARALKIVSIFAAVLILFMVAALVCDMMNHDLGFFWRR